MGKLPYTVKAQKHSKTVLQVSKHAKNDKTIEKNVKTTLFKEYPSISKMGILSSKQPRNRKKAVFFEVLAQCSDYQA